LKPNDIAFLCELGGLSKWPSHFLGHCEKIFCRFDMSISTFFNSYAGMYAAQAFCHALIAAVIMERALKAWKISDPVNRQRFSLVVVLFPIISFPLFQALDPGRSSVLFRLNALFDSNRWLDMELWGTIPLSILFLLVLAATSLVFLFQEMVPVLRHTLESNNLVRDGMPMRTNPFLEQASKTLSLETPQVHIIEDNDLLIFSTTGKKPVIFVSTGLTKSLTPDQLQAALAHEVAHIARSRHPVLLAVFFLRMLMFFNPVVLLEFRRAVRNEEKICDDIAVSLTQRPQALADTLKKFYAVRETPELGAGRNPFFTPVRLEEHSYNIQLDDRIVRLERNAARTSDSRRFPMIIACLVSAGINYFIV
jgi:hypothetical protein